MIEVVVYCITQKCAGTKNKIMFPSAYWLVCLSSRRLISLPISHHMKSHMRLSRDDWLGDVDGGCLACQRQGHARVRGIYRTISRGLYIVYGVCAVIQ